MLGLLPAGIFQVAVIIRNLLSESSYTDDYITHTRYLSDFVLKEKELQTDVTLHE
jgi:hypothetical protein